MLSYIQFIKLTPILYGQIHVNGHIKIGSFRSTWNKYTNSFQYLYFTPNGNKGSGGFTLTKAYQLYKANKLHIDPDKGHPENYI